MTTFYFKFWVKFKFTYQNLFNLNLISVVFTKYITAIYYFTVIYYYFHLYKERWQLWDWRQTMLVLNHFQLILLSSSDHDLETFAFFHVKVTCKQNSSQHHQWTIKSVYLVANSAWAGRDTRSDLQPEANDRKSEGIQ